MLVIETGFEQQFANFRCSESVHVGKLMGLDPLGNGSSFCLLFLKKEKNTLDTFGGLIHKYTIDEAVEDEAVGEFSWCGVFHDRSDCGLMGNRNRGGGRVDVY